MFYNTGIATYIWVLSNRKAEHRRGRVQLIDATQWSRPLRKNLGSKNCELSDEDIRRICDAFLAFEETEQSKIFPNEAFGYWKVTVERPLRLDRRSIAGPSPAVPSRLCDAKEEPTSIGGTVLGAGGSPRRHSWKSLSSSAHGVKQRPSVRAWAPEASFPARARFNRGLVEAGSRRGVRAGYRPAGYRAVPLLHEGGGIEAFLRREVLPYAPKTPGTRPSA